MSARELVEQIEAALPIIEGLETGQECADYAFARGKGFQAMTYCPEAFEALRVLPAIIVALRRVEALEAENARMRDALELAANRLHRTVLEYEPNSTGYYEMSEWAREARAALAGGSDEG